MGRLTEIQILPVWSRQNSLEVYLLPVSAWQDIWNLQQRLVYELSAQPRTRTALILCEHEPIITVGRQGSRRHLRIDEEELQRQGIALQWTNRGGGCWLHQPGQLCFYPILPLETDRPIHFLSLRNTLAEVVVDVLRDFQLVGVHDACAGGIVIEDREVAQLGFAIKNGVCYQGGWLNINPPHRRLNWLWSNPNRQRGNTSMFRERRLPVRVGSVRESFLRHFTQRLGFEQFHFCHPPEPTNRKTRRNNVTTTSR